MITLFEKMMKRIQEVNEKTGKKLLKLTFVIDMEEFSMKHMMYKPGRLLLMAIKIQ